MSTSKYPNNTKYAKISKLYITYVILVVFIDLLILLRSVDYIITFIEHHWLQ